LILLPNYLAFAAINTCPVGYVSDEFSSTDYSNLGSTASPPLLGINQLLNGLKSESYIVASNSLITTGSLDADGSNFYRPKTLVGGLQSFEFFQDFTNKASSRTASYTFKNSFTNESQALNNVSLSIYDIDVNYVGSTSSGTRYFEFSDQVTITGVTSSGTSVTPTLKYRGTGITTTAPYRQTTTTSDVLCGTDSVDEKCKISVAFDEPVVRVDVTYGNNPDLNYYDFSNFGNPGDQLIDIVFDGYCYLPQPRLTYTKALSTSRKTNTDQFTVQIKDNADNSVVTSGITSTTTTGSNNTVTTGTGTTGTFKVNPTKTYTLTEAGSGSTNLVDYTASYVCKKSDGATITTLDPNKLKLTYGDNWTCTITNGRPNYIFSGTVFNDNGGITASSADRQNISSTFASNSNYFNGAFDSATESGIYDSNLQIRLTNCSGTNIATTSPNPQTVSNTQATRGQYNFVVPASALANITRVCVVQNEPSTWDYNIDTTPNTREVALVNGLFNYKTESDGSRNLDFGEVKDDNAALVLIKSQYVHDCNASLNYQNVGSNDNPTVGFSINPISNIDAGKCIAYRIQAYNRGHIGLQQVQISDKLQSTPVASVFNRPAPLFTPTSTVSPTVVYDTNGTIQSNFFSLAAATNQPTSAILYFNTKHGTTQSN